MMRRAKRTLAPAGGIEPLVADRGDGSRFQRFFFSERRQDGGEAARQHGLAGAGRTDEKQIVTAGGGDLERAYRVRLAAHVAEVERIRTWRGALGCMRSECRRAPQMFAHLEQILGTMNRRAAHLGGLVGIAVRQYQCAAKRFM